MADEKQQPQSVLSILKQNIVDIESAGLANNKVLDTAISLTTLTALVDISKQLQVSNHLKAQELNMEINAEPVKEDKPN